VSVGSAGSNPAPPTKAKARSHRREDVADAQWLVKETQTFALELEALPTDVLTHQRKRAEIEPRARIELCERIIAGIKRRKGWT
jgi:hypothetical protein